MAIPNTTPTPNELYNGEMKKMSDTELRVVLAVTRKTLGWELDSKTGMRKKEDWISQSQIIKMTGRSGRAVSTAIESCIKNKWIEVRDAKGNLLGTPQKRSGKKIYYRLGMIFLEKIEASEKSSEDNNSSENSSPENSSPENSSLYKRKLYTKENYIQKEITPAEEAKEFFANEDRQADIIQYLIGKGYLPTEARNEIIKFIVYWTELNKAGTKQRWELEKTFQVKTRLGAWLANTQKFNRNKTIQSL
jgi:hypothetical protein